MSSCVAYEEVDFVDYFARATNVSEVHLARIAEEPKCLAVIDAVVKTHCGTLATSLTVSNFLNRAVAPG